ncbi:MAG TPA: VWA domain-containing protein [Terriglobales bacterium]|nr:VWA domain-containing protein [Terriglobales bacterium]
MTTDRSPSTRHRIAAPKRRGFALCLGLALSGMLLASCGPKKTVDFKFASGSENTILEPVVQDFCHDQGMNCSFDYKGSLDIGAMLAPGANPDVDAVWPAASLWIDLYDTSRKVKDLRSVSQSPVVLGVRLSKAKELGWTDRPVSTNDIVQAVRQGKLKFLMTSATQSNSGASAYLAMLAVLVGKSDVLQPSDLDDPRLQDQIKVLLSGVERSSGSSGWLKDLFMAKRADGSEFDAMWNYEAVIKEANDDLARSGGEKLWAVYPSDGVFVADSPLGFIDRGRGADVEALFNKLQDYLHSPEVQAKIAATGRRIALSGSGTAPKPEPDWNFDPNRLVTSIRSPAPDVISHALVLYQESLRRPSITAFCLDYSGSMSGAGESQLKDAMRFVLTPEEASQALVQWTPKDKIKVIIFTDQIEGMIDGTGAKDSQSNLLSFVDGHQAGGGTDMYKCLQQAEDWINSQADHDAYLPAILVMTDGKSDGDAAGFQRIWSGNPAIPIFSITFGDADQSQLDTLATLSRARVFDGKKDLRAAFRAARGYN